MHALWLSGFAVITPMRSRKAMPISINVHRVGSRYHCAREPAWRATKSLSPAKVVEKPRETALIDEAVCIGCTKCILACPVDAIVGASKMMHTVLVEECTGCELCVAPCPVD